ncbi:hypothetical protein AZE42_01675 [Rhizopogon vesiculosus]|uniref:TOG domain-containing protein n=1 Tax=Rhizopogon vesiculosus TaxID=180088 RepID=A0A1J8QNZ9_9AGAM|nr:hypothetical protein AZE42_01675 [Rhizopogon vesiculosus]
MDGRVTPPPVHHVLRPHHIDLIAMLLLIFKEFELQKTLPKDFLLYMYRVLLMETSEVIEHRSHQHMMAMVKIAPSADTPVVQGLVGALENVPNQLRAFDQLTNFFLSTPSIFVEKSDDQPAVLRRTSLFGYFVRRCFVSFVKLSFYGVLQLQKDYHAWVAGSNKAGYGPVEKDPLTADIWLFRTSSDLKSWARPEPFEAWEKGHATGDDIIGPENLRRYFEQHFHEHNDSGVRQHALLHLVRMHYVRKEYPAASKLLREAIAVARTSGDRITLQHCISMLHRLPSLNETPVLNEIQPDLHPLEVLFDVTKLLDPQYGQPLTLCFEKLTEAIALHNQCGNAKHAMPRDAEICAHNAMQAVVWQTLGCYDLASVEESFVLSITRAGKDDSNRLNTLINRSYRERVILRGFGTAIASRHMAWHFIGRIPPVGGGCLAYISAEDESSVSRDFPFIFVFTQPSSSSFVSKEYFFDESSTPLPSISMDLYEMMNARRRGQAVAAIQPLLQALWQAEFQGRFPLYRLGIILLADVGLEFGMSNHSQQLILGIMPQVGSITTEMEHRAFANHTLARCMIASSDESSKTSSNMFMHDTEISAGAGLRDALPCLLMAEADYMSLSMLEATSEVQGLLVVVYHNLGMKAEEEGAFERYTQSTRLAQTFEENPADPEATRVWDTVTEIGKSRVAITCMSIVTPLSHCRQLTELIPIGERPLRLDMDGPPPQEEDFSSLQISDRLNHKNWKARVSGYESLIKTFQTTASDSDPAFKPYVNNPDLLKKIATDSNAVAQEKGVECLVALIKFAGETAAKTRETVVPALVDKCLGSARAGTKNQAIELILQYVEVENSATGVVADIIPGLSAKQPKAVTGSVFALKEVVR